MHTTLWQHMGNFLYSNFFVGLVALGVGVAAYSVYSKQKRDSKRDSANIILLEIEHAEQQMQIVTQTQESESLNENIYLMRVASWEKYRYLFVRDFDRNEWDKVTDFYDKCQRYDTAVRYNNTFFKANEENLRTNLHRVLADYADEYVSTASNATPTERTEAERVYLEKRQSFIDMYMRTTQGYLYMYNPIKPVNDAKTVLSSIETSLSLTSVGIKLKRLARASSIWQRTRSWLATNPNNHV